MYVCTGSPAFVLSLILMASLSTRQNILRPTSNRAAVAHLGRAQQPQPRPMSNRALVGRVGVGSQPTVRVDSLLRPQPVAPLAPRPVFARLVSDAERLRQQLAQHERQAAATRAAADSTIAARPRPTTTPKQAGYLVPVLTPYQQA